MMYLVVRPNVRTIRYNGPFILPAYILRWIEDNPECHIFRFNEGSFEELGIKRELIAGGSGKCTQPIAVWHRVKESVL